jgi:hypothetical protein
MYTSKNDKSIEKIDTSIAILAQMRRTETT